MSLRFDLEWVVALPCVTQGVPVLFLGNRPGPSGDVVGVCSAVLLGLDPVEVSQQRHGCLQCPAQEPPLSSIGLQHWACSARQVVAPFPGDCQTDLLLNAGLPAVMCTLTACTVRQWLHCTPLLHQK